MEQTHSYATSKRTQGSTTRQLIQTKRWIFATLILVLLTGFGTHLLDKWMEHRTRGTSPDIRSGPWGDLQTWNIRLEQPLEYAGFEKSSTGGPFWNFGSLSADSIHQLLLDSGLTEEQSGRLLGARMADVSGAVVLKPDEQFLLSLTPDVRSKLYLALARNAANRYQAIPCFIPDGDIASLFDKKFSSNAGAISLMKKLLYTRNGFTYFSDPELVLKHIPNADERRDFLQSLTSQNAVLMRLLIKPDSEIEKPLNYWVLSMPGVLMKDLRPLFEAQQRLPQGGSISILYLLPPLARERLFTSPLPPDAGSAKLPDCHWTALNYFNYTPDPRLSDNEYASRFIADHYYEIAKPGIGGDLVLLLNSENRVVHSAVYIADDVVFTKNGISYAQPWILMHEKDLIGSFSALEPVKTAFFRRKGI